jgi:hypothetical protein
MDGEEHGARAANKTLVFCQKWKVFLGDSKIAKIVIGTYKKRGRHPPNLHHI